MFADAQKLIQQAEALFKERKLEESVQYYNEAGMLCREKGDALQAAECFAQCALCEKMRTGLLPLLEAANWSEMAAREALKAGQFAFARWQFREAGLFYEREGDFEKYSRCFVDSQDAYVQYLWHVFTCGEKQERIRGGVKAGWGERLLSLWLSFMGMVSRMIWGYGERPFNICFTAMAVILGSALIYQHSGLIAVHGAKSVLAFSDCLYLSGVTFSTLGYGDLAPLGWVRLLAFGESLAGFLMVPLLMIALTRRYLRLYR